MTQQPHVRSSAPGRGPAIATRGLTRTFTRHGRTVEAVRGLDLEVGPGELVALLGPNGAGKSTTLRMLTTLLAPTAGTATVAGHDVVRDHRAVRRAIGYVGQGNAAGHQQRGRDEVVAQGRAHGLGRREAGHRADELLEAFDLTEHAGRPVSTLSGGQRRRLDIAIGLVHRPPVLFLDEPSTGLDPQNRVNLVEQVRRLHRDLATTVVLTTHYLEEADALAERVVVVDHGRVIADDSAAALRSGLGDLVVLHLTTPDDAAVAARLAAGRLGDAAVETHPGPDDARVVVRAPHAADVAPSLIAGLTGAGVAVRRVEATSATLDDVFLELTGRSLREGGTARSDQTTPDPSTSTSTEGAAA